MKPCKRVLLYLQSTSPSSADTISSRLGISRTTVNHCLKSLTDEGTVTRHVTYIGARPVSIYGVASTTTKTRP